MSNDLHSTIATLTALMQQETLSLTNGGSTDAASAKQLLIDQLCAAWPAALDADGVPPAGLLAALDALAAEAQNNARRLERSIALSAELLDVVRDELARQTGASAMTYGISGSIHSTQAAARLACNRMM